MAPCKGRLRVGSDPLKFDAWKFKDQPWLLEPEASFQERAWDESVCTPKQYYNLLRPLIKILFLLVPSGYIIIKIKKNS